MIGIILVLFIGLILVVVGADYFIAGSSLIAKRVGVSKLIIGLTVVAIGTSAPELGVNIISSLKGYNDLALGNILGSNISNIFFIFAGASLCVNKFSISKDSLQQVVIGFWVSVMLILIAFLGFTDTIQISVSEGILLFLLGLVYFFYLYKLTLSHNKVAQSEDTIDTKLSHIKSLWLIVFITTIGLIALLYGSKLMTDNAVLIAKMFGIPELVISGTIIAIGTSLPELVASIQAVRQKQFELMLGNIVGSNIVNTLFVLSISSIINPIIITGHMSFVFLIINSIASSFLLVGFLLFGKQLFKRWEALFFLIMYCIFLIYSFL